MGLIQPPGEQWRTVKNTVFKSKAFYLETAHSRGSLIVGEQDAWKQHGRCNSPRLTFDFHILGHTYKVRGLPNCCQSRWLPATVV